MSYQWYEKSTVHHKGSQLILSDVKEGKHKLY